MKEIEIKIVENQKVGIDFDLSNGVVMVQKEFADRVKAKNLDWALFERLCRSAFTMYKIDKECAIEYGETYDAEEARKESVDVTVGTWLEIEEAK